MKIFFYIILPLIILFPSCGKLDLGLDVGSFQTPYPQPTPIIISTSWANPTQSDTKWAKRTDTLDLTPYSKVEISFNVDFNPENTTSHEYYFEGEFLKDDSVHKYLYGYQNENRAGYWLEINPGNNKKYDQIVFKMTFVTAPETVMYYNLNILGYKN